MINDIEQFNKTKEKINMDNLKLLRTKKGYSQVKLQHLVGVSTSSIEAYEQKVRIPSLPIIYRLSEVLNCSIDFLVGKPTEIDKYYLLSPNNKNQVKSLIEKLSKENN